MFGGELYHSVPWGYVLLPGDVVEQDPDEQVRAVVRLVFDKFQELGSAYALLRYLRQHDIKLPKRDSAGHLVWRAASESILQTQLRHPIYAGAYSWGRRYLQTRVAADGISAARRSHRLRSITRGTSVPCRRAREPPGGADFGTTLGSLAGRPTGNSKGLR